MGGSTTAADEESFCLPWHVSHIALTSPWLADRQNGGAQEVENSSLTCGKTWHWWIISLVLCYKSCCRSMWDNLNCVHATDCPLPHVIFDSCNSWYLYILLCMANCILWRIVTWFQRWCGKLKLSSIFWASVLTTVKTPPWLVFQTHQNEVTFSQICCILASFVLRDKTKCLI